MDSMYQEIEKGTKMNFFFFFLPCDICGFSWEGSKLGVNLMAWVRFIWRHHPTPVYCLRWHCWMEYIYIYIYIYIYSLSKCLCWASSQQPCDEIVGLFIFCPELWGNKAQAEQPFRMASEVKNTGSASFYYLWVVVQASPGSSKNVLHFTEWWEECQRICTCLKMQQQGLQKLTRDSSMP